MSKKFAKDSLGTRMKNNYENRSRHFFPRRTYTLIRIDGRAFHSWTRGLSKPYDNEMMVCMDNAALAIVKEAAGAQFAYVQSDEISILLTDFADISSEAWFNGNQSKLESITASLATVGFNVAVMEYSNSNKINNDLIRNLGNERGEFRITEIGKKYPDAVFDSRAWTVSDPVEVENYFIWRQKDAERNSVTLLASAYASHKELHGKSTAQRHDIIHKAGDNWNNHPIGFKRGRVIRRMVDAPEDVHTEHCGTPFYPLCKYGDEDCTVMNAPKRWMVDSQTPIFTGSREYLRFLIPEILQSEKEY